MQKENIMKLSPIQNAVAATAAVFLIIGKYGDYLFQNFVIGIASGLFLAFVLLNWECYMAFWKRVCGFLYLRWQWKQRYKLEKLARMDQYRQRQS